jgi:hypothetical protein
MSGARERVGTRVYRGVSYPGAPVATSTRAHTRVNTACGARKASHTLAIAQRREIWHARCRVNDYIAPLGHCTGLECLVQSYSSTALSKGGPKLVGASG